MMWDIGMGTGLWGGWLGMLTVTFFGLLVLVGLIMILVWFMRTMGGGPRRSGDQESASSDGDDPALRIARERFAHGEISKEELQEILQTLRG